MAVNNCKKCGSPANAIQRRDGANNFKFIDWAIVCSNTACDNRETKKRYELLEKAFNKWNKDNPITNYTISEVEE